jgi:hypothetical protein
MGVFTTASQTFAVGDQFTAAWQNGQVRDFIDGFGAWTAYTPTFTAGGGGTNVGAGGSISGAYCRIGKLVHFRVILVIGTGASITGAWSFTLPVTPASTTAAALPLSGIAYDNGTAWYAVTPIIQSGALVPLTFSATGSYAQGAVISNAVPFTFDNTDQLIMTGTYEAA